MKSRSKRKTIAKVKTAFFIMLAFVLLFAAVSSAAEQDSDTDSEGYWSNYICRNCGSDKDFQSVGSASADPITISRSKAELAVDEKLQLTVDDVFNKVKWSSSDKKVATVSKKGLVKAKATGIVQIKAEDEGGNEAVCLLHVKYTNKDNKDSKSVQEANEKADKKNTYDYMVKNGFLDKKKVSLDAFTFEADENDAIKVSKKGLSHDWEEVQVEEVFIDEAQLAASLRGEVVRIEIPENLGDLYSVTCYGIPGWKLGGVVWRSIVPNSQQARVHDMWVACGAKYTNGIATIGDRYLVATTTYFGEVGSYVTFICKNGYELRCIIGDSKGSPKAAGSKWGHAKGRNVVEFEVDPDYYNQYGNPGSSVWFPEIAGGVAAAIRE